MRVKIRERDTGAVIRALTQQVGRLTGRREMWRKRAKRAETEVERLTHAQQTTTPNAFAAELLPIIQQYSGERGRGETAVETFRRIIGERDEARQELKNLRSSTYGRGTSAKPKRAR